MIPLAAFILVTAVSASVHVVTEKDDKATVRMTMGDLIKIQVRTNPTTGFSWDLEYPHDALVLSKDEITQDRHPVGMVGYPSTQEIQLKPLKAGTSKIEMKYRRPWEKGKDPVRALTFTVVVK